MSRLFGVTWLNNEKEKLSPLCIFIILILYILTGGWIEPPSKEPTISVEWIHGIGGLSSYTDHMCHENYR